MQSLEIHDGLRVSPESVRHALSTHFKKHMFYAMRAKAVQRAARTVSRVIAKVCNHCFNIPSVFYLTLELPFLS